MRSLLAIAMALVLAGCGTFGRRGDAPVADADDACYQACTASLTDTGVRWNANAEDPKAWDALGNVVLPALSARLLACERARQSCTDFIDSLKRRGIIRGRKP